MIWIKAISLFCTYFTINHVALISRSYCQAQGCSLEIRGRLSEAFAIGNVLKDIFTKVSNEEHNEHDNKLITSIVECFKISIKEWAISLR